MPVPSSKFKNTIIPQSIPERHSAGYLRHRVSEDRRSLPRQVLPLQQGVIPADAVLGKPQPHLPPLGAQGEQVPVLRPQQLRLWLQGCSGRHQRESIWQLYCTRLFPCFLGLLPGHKGCIPNFFVPPLDQWKNVNYFCSYLHGIYHNLIIVNTDILKVFVGQG